MNSFIFLCITEHWCGCLIIQYPTDTGVPTYFPVKTSWSEQGRVESVGSVGGHDHLDLTERVKAVHLVQQLSGGGKHIVKYYNQLIYRLTLVAGITGCKVKSKYTISGKRHLKARTRLANYILRLANNCRLTGSSDKYQTCLISYGRLADCNKLNARICKFQHQVLSCENQRVGMGLKSMKTLHDS